MAAEATMAGAAAQEAVGRFVGVDLGVSCVVASSPADDRYAVTVNTNDVSGRSTPASVSYDSKMRHVGVSAEGRAMSAPRQTFTHLPMTLGDAAKSRARADRYAWLFEIQEDGQMGPVTFNNEEFSVRPCGVLGTLLRTLVSYASGAAAVGQVCVAVHDYMPDEEIAVVRDALRVAGLEGNLLRQSDALAAAFVQGTSGQFFLEGVAQRTVAFVDLGSSHGTVSVVRFSQPPAPEGGEAAPAEIAAEFLYRKSDEAIGVHALVEALLSEARSRIEAKHNCTVKMRGKSGVRLANEAVHTLKQLSMLPDAELSLEAFLPEGPEGPEIDVSVPFTRDAFESKAQATFARLRELLAEAFAAAPEGTVEGVELVGGGSRVPAVQALVKEAAGEAPLRFGLDGASCVAVGAAAWAAGRRVAPALAVEGPGLGEDALAEVRALEERVEVVHSAEVKRLDVRNALEGYVYQVRDWLSSKDAALLQPDVVGPFLDKVTLWFEDAEMAEEPTSLEVYQEKFEEAQEFVKKEGEAFFEKRKKDREEQEAALDKAAEEERQRRKELGMDADKDDRHMKKEDRMRLAAKNKDEGNDMFKAQKYDDAIRRYKKAIEHVSRPEAVSNMTPEEAEEAKKIKVSCHLNSAQCYIKAAETAFTNGGKNAAEPFYKKAKTSCEDVLSLDDKNVKASFRLSLCWEKMGELEGAMKEIKKGLAVDPENVDLKKSQERLTKLLQKQKDGQKKVFSKMFG